MANVREGFLSPNIGVYIGSYFDESEALSLDDMQWNAFYIWDVLFNSFNWTENAIAALLGNMQAESSMNPGRWQIDDVGNTSGGYGLVQWTPATKYINWVESGNSLTDDPSEMDNNLFRIHFEAMNGMQWISTSSYPLSFKEFIESEDDPGELAKAFLLNYERPADQSSSVQNYRAALANYWYQWITNGELPDVPELEPETKTGKKKGYNFLLFNRRRRTGHV